MVLDPPGLRVPVAHQQIRRARLLSACPDAIMSLLLQESLAGWGQGRKDRKELHGSLMRLLSRCSCASHREPSELSGTAVAEP